MNKRLKRFLIILVICIVFNVIIDFYANVAGISITGGIISILVYKNLWAIEGAVWIVVGSLFDDND